MGSKTKMDALDIDFAALTRDRLETMVAAGEEVLDCHRVLAKSDTNIVGEILPADDTFYEWNHYPEGDVYDHASHAQFYYHAHPQELRFAEHGHFHTFLRPLGMPSAIMPAPVADLEIPAGENDALSHLVAISMDKYGVPTRLFTTNRWVTGEVWYVADDVRAMLEHFEIDLARPSWPLNRWITALLRLFQPQIAMLLKARDRRIAGWAATKPDCNVYEDRDLEITSVLKISIDDQIRRAREVLAARG